MSTRKIRSVTLRLNDEPPAWARYVVRVASTTRTGVEQAFRARSDAEKWALALAHRLPMPTEGMPERWVGVHALHGRNRSVTYGAVCYAAFDPGGVRVKRHLIPNGYGRPASRVA